MAQWLGVLAVLSEDLGSILSKASWLTHLLTPVPGDLMPSSGSAGTAHT